MGTLKGMAKRKAMKGRKLSDDPRAMTNRAGGVAFDIDDPATKLLTMTGGAFFAEPRFYNGDTCVPTRGKSGQFERMKERIRLSDSRATQFADCEELDDVAREVISTALNIFETDHPDDTLRIANWLRNEAHIRLTPQVLLVISAAHEKGKQFVQEFAPKIVVRPDEVKTCMLLHRFFFGLRPLPGPLSKGLAEALSKFDERALLKYNTPGYPTWKDVICTLRGRKSGYPLKQPVARFFQFGELDGRKTPVLYAAKKLTQCEKLDDEAKRLISKAGANWEVVLSQFGTTAKGKRDAWSYLINENLVGYMALLRNLKSLLQAGVSDVVMRKACEKLSNAEQVRRSKQLPFRFTMAFQILGGYGHYADTSMGYGSGYGSGSGLERVNRDQLKMVLEAIEDAAEVACENVPRIPGTTAVFADNSGSMSAAVSAKSQMSRSMASNTLAGICAKNGEKAMLFGFGTDVAEVRYTKCSTVLSLAKAIARADTKGMSTNGYRCFQWLESHGAKPDRIILLSDMQCWSDGWGGGGTVADAWQSFRRKSPDTWLHSIHINGYGDSPVPRKGSGNVNLVSGFSEKVISMLLEVEGVLAAKEEKPLPSIEQIREKW